jgi:hypothetical protein
VPSNGAEDTKLDEPLMPPRPLPNRHVQSGGWLKALQVIVVSEQAK